MKPKVLIVGASCRAAAQCAVADGYAVVAADSFLDRDLIECATTHLVDPFPGSAQSLVNTCRGATLLLAGGMENYPDIADELVAGGLRAGVNGNQLRTLRNPENWELWAVASGLLWPATGSSLGPPQAHAQTDCLVKTLRSAGGLGVRRWTGERLLPDEYLQQFVAGDSIGIQFLSDHAGTAVVGIARSLQPAAIWAPTPFAYRGSIAPVTVPTQTRETVNRFATRVSNETGIRGLWQADFVFNETGLWLLEINPRWSASMELTQLVNRWPLVHWHVQACAGATPTLCRELQSPTASSGIVGKAIRYAKSETKPSPIELAHWWSHRLRIEPSFRQQDHCSIDSSMPTNDHPIGVGASWFADIPASDQAIPESAPILTVGCWERTESECERRLAAQVVND
jgi:predicted ATP-grasp superfamily ATP-dependent carboligase